MEDKIYKIATLADLKELDISKPLMIDTETSRLGSEIRLIQLYQKGMEKVLIFDTLDHSVEMLYMFIIDFHLVGHNFLYDLGCFKADLGDKFMFPKRWDDTFYASRLVAPQWEKYSLDLCFLFLLRYCPYSNAGLDKKKLQTSFERLKTKYGYIEGNAGLPHLTDRQYLYAAIDVYYLWQLWEKVEVGVKEFNYQLDKSVAEKSVQMQDNGMPVSLEGLKETEKKYNEEFAELTKILNGLNSASYQQVRKALGTERSSDGPALAIIASRKNGFEGLKQLQKIDGSYDMVLTEPNYVHSDAKAVLAKNIQKMRHARMRLSYVKRTYDAMNENKRINAQFSPHAITGRVQPNNENLSQWPRDMKKIWGFDGESDRVLVYSDYSQLELRTVCAVIGEENMYRAYKQGIDLHDKTEKEAKIDASKLPAGMKVRMVAKMLNFLSLYGGGVDSFQKQFVNMTNTWLDADLVQESMASWKNVYSGVKQWHADNSKRLNKGDYLWHTVCGRPYHTQAFTEYNNIQIQGSGAEVAKLAWNYLFKYGVVNNEGLLTNEVENTSDVKMVNFVHDAVLIDCPNDPKVYEAISRKLAACFQIAWFQVMRNSKFPDLDMPVDVSVDKNWDVIENGEPQWSMEIDGMKYRHASPDVIKDVV